MCGNLGHTDSEEDLSALKKPLASSFPNPIRAGEGEGVAPKCKSRAAILRGSYGLGSGKLAPAGDLST